MAMNWKDWVLIGIIGVIGVVLIPITIKWFFAVLLYMMVNPLQALGILVLMMVSFYIGMNAKKK